MELIYKNVLITISVLFAIISLSVTQPIDRSHNPNILDIEPPKYFVFGQSPLQNPSESLRQENYYSFLNTLYRHDRSKANLFDVPAVYSPPQQLHRNKRAVVFRPLFVYRQQQVKKQRIQEERRRYRRRYRTY